MPSPRGVAAVVVTLVVAAMVVVLVRAGQPPAVQADRAPTTQRAPAALRMLHAWDERRAAAYAAGSVAGLRELYVPGSTAGGADVRMLRGYRARHLRVSGMRMQVLALVVLRAGPGRWRLRVTDRLVGATVAGAGRRIVLPHDEASTRMVSMMRGADGHWRVASVSDVS
jgi:hypothetical protein